jgi:hypothetical protein
MAITMSRLSPRGLKFRLTELNNNQTLVELGNKSITMNQSIIILSQAWYYWQMDGKHIQEAFPMLPAEHREFLLSGITPEEWNEIFAEEED